ncbi:MAG TPA: cobalamin biosynthesis protein CobD [Firmicutes bacterium]|nr:cobalamin biosynthesis protein CobD [Candidatus Fermentithermobacillaceae bacterium]
MAFGVDSAAGDPPRKSHPVVIMGRAICILESALRSFCTSKKSERLMGGVLAAAVVCGSFFACKLVIALAACINPVAGTLVSLWLMSTTLAARDLKDAAYRVYAPLKQGNLPEARGNLQMIVGRDTGSLPYEEIVRAAVETVAENTSDGVIAPLFYGFIGGAPLAMAYKAVNTLDSMVGYKNDRYLDFGWASAKLDDLANYIPARISGALLVMASCLLGLDARRALLVIQTDAKLHPSPNSGVCEGAVAGALGVRLGGLNFYGGVPSFRQHMGKPLQPLESCHIRQAVALMYLSSALGVVIGTAISLGCGVNAVCEIGPVQVVAGLVSIWPICMFGGLS